MFQNAHQIFGGEQQRAAIARALNDPERVNLS
jgi:predicted ABC-type transport system involved in lysophospholipase L1 biosynthesis ATPase subunit